MKIIFSKESTKPSTLTCVRDDGSSTWAKMHGDIEVHDLAHYVAETELGFLNAFYGLVAQGYDIGDFELPRDQRPEALLPKNLPVEAIQTEHLVNLLQIDLNDSESSLDILQMLRSILEEKGINFPLVLTGSKLSSIRIRLKALQNQWNNLDEGGSMILDFSNQF